MQEFLHVIFCLWSCGYYYVVVSCVVFSYVEVMHVQQLGPSKPTSVFIDFSFPPLSANTQSGHSLLVMQ